MSILPQVVQDLIEQFESLPGIGPRSAARLAYFFLRAPETYSKKFASILAELKDNIQICSNCYNYTDKDVCDICSDIQRDDSVIMVVEEALDVVAFERMGAFNGKYHVLGGIISPINGIGPEELRIIELINRLKNLVDIAELIIATNPSLEGESTALYIKKELEKNGIVTKITRLARGLPTGADLEYADNTTLEKALEGRTAI